MTSGGAKLLTIDPRFTRTSAVADRHMQIRPGADIAVLGGLIRYALANDLHHADYVRAHTNASFVVGEQFGFEDGLFAGFDEAAGNYDRTAWGLRAGLRRLRPARRDARTSPFRSSSC